MAAVKKRRLVVFVHGWSVTNTDTYGGLPERLVAESAAFGVPITVKEIFLGEYVSFKDEVRVVDLARAFEEAFRRDVRPHLAAGEQFACITHSTGGPVAREWCNRYYWSARRKRAVPVSHLIMLAPANFGSALAQLGKGRLSRLKSWWNDVEPGQGVLDWLELGSRESWALNQGWLSGIGERVMKEGFYPFVLTGQTIDRAWYDHLNSYTGETGSDGVVRVAAANLNANYVLLEQEALKKVGGKWSAPKLARSGPVVTGPKVALGVMRNRSHSGKNIGIMRCVSRNPGGADPTVSAIFDALKVDSATKYAAVRRALDRITQQVQKDEQVEKEDGGLFGRDTYFVHDRYSMIVFRVRDSEGFAVTDFDLLLTAGENYDPNHLPRGFFVDRQCNHRDRNTITYFVSYDVMMGTEEVWSREKKVKDRKKLRSASDGVGKLGIRIVARPSGGFVHYLPCELRATKAILSAIILPNRTTLVDIVLRRVVHEGAFRINQGVQQGSFKDTPEGPPIV